MRRPVSAGGSPSWSPDGRLLAVVRARSLWASKADGSGAARAAGWSVATPAWSPGDDVIAFNRVKDVEAPNPTVAQCARSRCPAPRASASA